MSTSKSGWVVRLDVTDTQKKALKVLAVREDVQINDLITEAVRTSPLTAKVFK